jgi:hypothetical protein
MENQQLLNNNPKNIIYNIKTFLYFLYNYYGTFPMYVVCCMLYVVCLIPLISNLNIVYLLYGLVLFLFILPAIFYLWMFRKLRTTNLIYMTLICEQNKTSSIKKTFGFFMIILLFCVEGLWLISYINKDNNPCEGWSAAFSGAIFGIVAAILMIKYDGPYYVGMELKMPSNLNIKINNPITNSKDIIDQLFVICYLLFVICYKFRCG